MIVLGIAEAIADDLFPIASFIAGGGLNAKVDFAVVEVSVVGL
jgi:Na+-transporting NADH:ubiquinone oxidoreductase subunit NqrD